MSKCDRCGYVFGDSSDQWIMHALTGDCIKHLKSENERLREELLHVRKQRRDETELYVDMVQRCDIARDAAREFAEYRPVPQAIRDNWIDRFPWLGGDAPCHGT